MAKKYTIGILFNLSNEILRTILFEKRLASGYTSIIVIQIQILDCVLRISGDSTPFRLKSSPPDEEEVRSRYRKLTAFSFVSSLSQMNCAIRDDDKKTVSNLPLKD